MDILWYIYFYISMSGRICTKGEPITIEIIIHVWGRKNFHFYFIYSELFEVLK